MHSHKCLLRLAIAQPGVLGCLCASQMYPWPACRVILSHEEAQYIPGFPSGSIDRIVLMVNPEGKKLQGADICYSDCTGYILAGSLEARQSVATRFLEPGYRWHSPVRMEDKPAPVAPEHGTWRSTSATERFEAWERSSSATDSPTMPPPITATSTSDVVAWLTVAFLVSRLCN